MQTADSTDPQELLSGRKHPFSPQVLAALALIILLIAGFLFLTRGKKANAPTKDTQSKTSTSSATSATGECGTNQELTNTKQGYKVCYPTGWQQADMKTSSLVVGFDPVKVTTDQSKILVTISDSPSNVQVQDITNSSSKFEYGKESVDNIKGTQVTYTREKSDPLFATFPVAISTFVTRFGRTYAILLNTSDVNLTSDTKLYQDFLNSWKFIDNTQSPPWSDSRNILVYSPWLGDTVGKTISLSGEAIAFEGVVNIRVKDKDGHTLEQTTTQTQEGNTRSPFSVELNYESPTTKEGTVEVYTVSAADGSEQDKVTIPIKFP